MQQDPDPGELKDPSSFNSKYIYVGNDPLDRTDPTGHKGFNLGKALKKAVQKISKAVDKGVKHLAEETRKASLKSSAAFDKFIKDPNVQKGIGAIAVIATVVCFPAAALNLAQSVATNYILGGIANGGLTSTERMLSGGNKWLYMNGNGTLDDVNWLNVGLAAIGGFTEPTDTIAVNATGKLSRTASGIIRRNPWVAGGINLIVGLITK